MGIRETIRQNPRAMKAIAGTAIIIAVIGIAITLRSMSQRYETQPPPKAFFTIDNGKTLFTDDATLIPPFPHQGEEAVGAVVFTTDGGNHRWVQYLVKCIESNRSRVPPGATVDTLVTLGLGLVKVPGASDWLLPSDPRYEASLNPRIPPGIPDGPVKRLAP
jgi:hypothetical protein